MKKNETLPFLTLSLLLFASSHPSLSSPPPNDTWALTQFCLQTDTHAYLHLNWTGSDACTFCWTGVRCSTNKARVVTLSLHSLNLWGPLDSLASLDQLRLLDLHNNRLNSTVSPLVNCTKLKLLYLADNDLFGEIPSEISSLRLLFRLDLVDNNLRGPFPDNLTRLTQLLTLRLQNNTISGEIPDLSASLADLKKLNFTNNELYGRLSAGLLKKFGDKSFSGNEGLCGLSPLLACSFY